MIRRFRAFAAFAGLVVLIAPDDGVAQVVNYIEIAPEEVRFEGSANGRFNFYVGVGDDSSLTSVSVTPPGKAPVSMAGPDASNEFEFDPLPSFLTLAALRSSYPLGDYLFEFNGGVGSGGSEATVAHPQENFPVGFADITSPAWKSTTTSNPTISWTICSGCESDDGLEVYLYDLTTGTLVDDAVYVPPISGSIAPTGLPANHAYVFVTSLYNRVLTNLSFEYYDEAYNTKVTLFTVPEPGAPAMLVTGVAMLLGLSRLRSR